MEQVLFREEPNLVYTVQAKNSRYAVCTRPIDRRVDAELIEDLSEEEKETAAVYTLIDFENKCRSTNNKTYNPYDYKKVEDCRRCLLDLIEGTTELSRRNGIPLDILRQKGTSKSWMNIEENGKIDVVFKDREVFENMKVFVWEETPTYEDLGTVKTNPESFEDMVAKFMITCGQPVYAERRNLTGRENDFRQNLLHEEVQELKEALESRDRVAILDALCDILYITIGTQLTRGTAYKMGRGAKDVIKRNKNKSTKTIPKFHPQYIAFLKAQIWQLDKPIEESRAVIDLVSYISRDLGIEPDILIEAFHRVHYSNMTKTCSSREEAEESLVEGAEIRESGNRFIIVRKSDGKVLKPKGFWPVELEDLVW